MAEAPLQEFSSAGEDDLQGCYPFVPVSPLPQPFLFWSEPFPLPKGKFYLLVEFRFLVGGGRVSVSLGLASVDTEREENA